MISTSKHELKFISNRLEFSRVKSILGISKSTFYRIKSGKTSSKYQLSVEALYLSLKENKIPTPKARGRVLSQSKIFEIVKDDEQIVNAVKKTSEYKVKLKKWHDVKSIKGLKTYVEIIFLGRRKIFYNTDNIVSVVQEFFKMPIGIGKYSFARILVKGKLHGRYVTLWKTTNIDRNDFNMSSIEKYKDILSYVTASGYIEKKDMCVIYTIELHFYK